MATAAEDFESREGDSTGVFGDVSRTRVFKVTVDAVTDSPMETLQELRPGGVPLGSLHPEAGRNGIVSLMYTRGRRWSRLTWSVIVHYGPPIFFPTEQPYWEIAFRGSQEQEFITHDLDGLPIGQPRFEKIDPNTSPPDGSPVFETTITETDGSTRTQHLYIPNYFEPSKRHTFIQGVMRYRRGGELLLQRTFAGLPNAVDSVLASVNTVNADVFRVRIADFNKAITVAQPGQLMLMNADANPMPGVLVGQVIPNRIWQVVLLMRYSVTPWTPYAYRTMYRHDNGYESAVTYEGEPIQQSRRRYDTIPFTELIGLFDRSTGSSVGGRLKP